MSNRQVLQEFVDIIAEPITILLNKTLEYGDIPPDWKCANVSPIYNKGAKIKPIITAQLVFHLEFAN